MNIDERDKRIANRIKQATGMTDDHEGLSMLVEHCGRRIKNAQEVIHNWAKNAEKDPTNAIQWGGAVIGAHFELLFWMQTLNIICDAEDDAQRFSRLKIKLDELRGALLTGQYEQHSTCLLTRGVGELQMAAARLVLRSFNELVRAVEKQGW